MKAAEKFWDKKAAGYAQSQIGDQASYQRKLAETQQLLDPDMRVLELGCGTGSTAIEHAPFVAHIDALDISDNMLQIARQRAAEAGVSNVSFIHGDLAASPAKPASYDGVLALNVIHLLRDRKALFRQVAELVKPGGFFVSSTGCLSGSYLRFLKLVVPVAKLFNLLPDIFVFSEVELVEELEAAGFTIETRWHHGMDDITVFIIARKTPV